MTTSDSTSQESATKKRRLDSSSSIFTSPPSANLSSISDTPRHPEYYFPDGNIILAVSPDSTRTTLFRVLKSQLARHSQVFGDMMEVPSPNAPNAQDLFEGCPVVRLQDDPDDIAYIMSLLWSIQPTDPSLDYILGVLRISTKYVFSDARQWALKCLRELLPMDEEAILRKSHLTEWRTNGMAARLILTADKCDVPEMLPLAYFALATEDWSSAERREQIQLQLLNQHHLLAIAAGKAMLQQRLGMMLFSKSTIDLDINFRRCTRMWNPGQVGVAGSCQVFRSRAWNYTKASVERYLKLGDPILWVKEEREPTALPDTAAVFGQTFCNACATEWAARSDATIRKVFDEFCKAIWPEGVPK